MKFNDLITKSRQSSKRVGRGISGGGGKTAGRGTKGQNSRSGGGTRPGFEGGQNPLMQRLPKLRGFKSRHTAASEVYTGQLEGLKVKTADNQTLADAGLVASQYDAVKLIARGELKKALTVNLQGASAAALKQIEKAGGTFTMAEMPKRPASKPKEK